MKQSSIFNKLKGIFSFLLLFSLSLQAQGVKQDSVSLSRELTLEREYNPVLNDASKINQLPELKEPEAPKSQVEFSKYTIPFSIFPYLHKLSPASYFAELDAYKQKGYLNLGVSSLLDIDGDLGYQLLNTNIDFLSIYASHRSTNSNVTYLQDDIKQKMKINDNLIGVDYHHNFEKVLFSADAQYTYSAFNYYGVNNPKEITNSSGEIISPDFIHKNKNQGNNLFQTHFGITSVNNDEITYKANLAYTFFNQKYGYTDLLKGRTENRIMGDIDLHAHINSTVEIGVKGYLKTYAYHIPEHAIPQGQVYIYKQGENQMLSFTDEEYYRDIQDYTTLSATPYLTFEGDNWNAQVGFSVNAQVGGFKKFLLAPDVRFNWLPIERFQFYLSAIGGISDNSNYKLYYENRYIAPFHRVLDSKSPLDGTLGFDFSILPNLNIGLFSGYKITQDEHFYINFPFILSDWGSDIIMGQFVMPQYVKSHTFKLGGSLKYFYQDIFDLELNGTYYKWNIKKLLTEEFTSSLNKELLPWNKPVFTGDMNIGFNVPSLPFRTELAYHLETGRKSFDFFTDGRKMKDIHDLSFKGTYSINKTISAYVAINNLLFQKYDLWYGYPSENFNIMIGISVKF